jgi:hypothetical protein
VGGREDAGEVFMSKRIASRLASGTLAVAFAAFAQGQPSKAPDGGGATPVEAAAGGTPAAAAAPAVAAVTAAPPAAAAATAAAPAGVRADSPCKHDIELFCTDVAPGEGRLYKCLAEKDSELSNSCKTRLADLRATGGECKADIEKLCSSVPHSRGKLAQCLSEHHAELSEGCKTLAVPGKGATAAGTPAPAAAAATSAPTTASSVVAPAGDASADAGVR